MNANDKIYFLKQIECLGQIDFEEIWPSPGEAYLIDLYVNTRKQGKSNFDFLFMLEIEEVIEVFKYLDRR